MDHAPHNPFVALSVKISRRLDSARDKKTCGEDLGRFVASPYSESHGATGSQSAPYRGLEEIFGNIDLTPEDSFIDIGCGKGRVLAYLAGTGAPCRITGVELNPEVASVAGRWSARFPNVEVINGDAFDLDYNGYTVLFMYRPMEKDTFMDFIDMLEKSLTHNITFIYYADGQSGYYLNDRPGWKLIKRKEIMGAGGLYIHKEPQRYSIWKYSPG
ncbi:MAG: class I SAM-dependent methyltransferase [Clostridiales bacterium]|nr:class I SAM-dependent methyltransferase [Clostridiales bacterium]